MHSAVVHDAFLGIIRAIGLGLGPAVTVEFRMTLTAGALLARLVSVLLQEPFRAGLAFNPTVVALREELRRFGVVARHANAGSWRGIFDGGNDASASAGLFGCGVFWLSGCRLAVFAVGVVFQSC